MKSGLIAGFIAVTLAATQFAPAYASDTAGKSVSFTFAPASQGREILTARDDFVRRLSRFDRSARLKTGRVISERAYLRFVGENVRDWSGNEKALVESALSAVRPRINELALPWPETIHLVKTTGNEEGRAAYTRGNAIVLPAHMLVPGAEELIKKIISHELFHILSRNNPGLKDRLYAAIGFYGCGEIAYPSRLKQVKLTNPDAPGNDYCIRLRVAGVPTWAIPVLYSRTPEYDEKRGGEFFDYLQFEFLLVEAGDAADPLTATYDDEHIQLVGSEDVSGFYEQVGRNTGYIIHPEEILADNFALLVLGTDKVPSPKILGDIRKILDQARTGGQ
ncbi:MAG: hypothetical protein ACOY9D_12045 [Pseudomonadota bacterium]